jgi:hypothetical protein
VTQVPETPSGDRTLHSRFEIKYLVPADQVAAMRRFIQPFVRPDPNALPWPGYIYPICSLYLDDRDFSLCRSTMQGIKNRFKLRIRSYSDDPLAPVFCEIKRRVDRIILKERACIGREDLRAVLEDGRRPPGTEGLTPGARASLGRFRALLLSMQARPVARIRYLREAYEGSTGEPLRVTFDTAVQWRLTPGYEVARGGEEWSDAPVGATILEVKFTNRYPAWVRTMVQLFQLRQESVAKYVLSILACGRLQGQAPAMARPRGGALRPPQRGGSPGRTEAA